nr:hypothetical protein [uncultured Flavobacterium sp.]
MRNIVILGTGAVAAELTSYIADNNLKVTKDEKINIKGYIDFEYNIEKYWKKYKLKSPVLCDIDCYVPSLEEEILIGISDINFRSKMIEILLNKNAKITSFVHNTVLISDTVILGIGNIIYPFCIVGPDTVIGDFNMITSFSSISHDCIIGNSNFFSTTGISANVKIGSNNFFGIRSIVTPYIKIGSSNIFQAGMVVEKNVDDDSTLFYKYKEQVIAIPK